jgi:hypothetical protein
MGGLFAVPTIQFSDEIGKVQHLDHGEMTRIFLEQLLLLVNSYRKSAIVSTVARWVELPGSPTVESFAEPFDALLFILFDMFAKFLMARHVLECMWCFQKV